MTDRPDKRFLIAALIFGIAATGAGVQWLSAGEIVIRGGRPRSRSVSVQPSSQEVAGRIQRGDLLYYPLCSAWITLGTSMITNSIMAFFTARVLYAKLSAYSLAAVLPLGFTTVAAAIWSGP